MLWLSKPRTKSTTCMNQTQKAFGKILFIDFFFPILVTFIPSGAVTHKPVKLHFENQSQARLYLSLNTRRNFRRMTFKPWWGRQSCACVKVRGVTDPTAHPATVWCRRPRAGEGRIHGGGPEGGGGQRSRVRDGLEAGGITCSTVHVHCHVSRV